jgi:signal transduction histidine kinase
VAYTVPFRNIYVLLFCCFLAACNTVERKPESENKIDILVLADKLSVIARDKMLVYADSVYNAQKDKTPYLKAGWLMAHANYYNHKELYPKAAIYADSAIVIIERQNLNDSSWSNYYYASYITKASLLYKTGHYSRAIDTYFKIKEFADKADNKCGIGYKLNNNIGLILYKQQKYEEAIKYFRLALAESNNCSENKGRAYWVQQFLDNIGLCFYKRNKIDSALTYYRSALLITVTDSDKFNSDPVLNKASRAICRGVIISNIAQAFVKQNKLDSAELLFKENIIINAVAYKAEIKYAQLSQMQLAALYGLKKQYSQMKEVLADLRKSLDTLNNDEAELGWRKLTTEYDSKNNLPKQMNDYGRYISFRDSLENVKKSFDEEDITRGLETRAQHLEISLLQKDNQLTHLYLWVTISLSVMALTIVALIYSYYKRGKRNIRTLTLLNREVNEQNDKLEFAMVELEKSNSDKERILKVVAHDLRNPISGISSLVNTIINDDMDEADIQQNLTLIEKASANSLTLINELQELNLSPGDLGLDKKITDINDTVKQCLGLMQLNAAKKNQKLHFIPLRHPADIYIDRERIERMVNNLLGNAIKFSPVFGEIIIELRQRDKAVLISVKDNGIGVPAEMQADIFNTFGSTRRKGTAGEKSFGLGLSICKQIAEAHGGKIWVQSETGNGSEFFVELPL